MMNKSKKVEATVTFFKPTGKFYAEEKFSDFTSDEQPSDVFEKIKKHFAGKYKGMHMVITFESDDDSYGFPFMEPAEYRM